MLLVSPLTWGGGQIFYIITTVGLDFVTIQNRNFLKSFSLGQVSLLWKFELNWMSGCWEKFVWWWWHSIPSPLDFRLWTWTWIVTINVFSLVNYPTCFALFLVKVCDMHEKWPLSIVMESFECETHCRSETMSYNLSYSPPLWSQ